MKSSNICIETISKLEMQQQNGLVFLLLLFVAKYHAQTETLPPDWSGDPTLCTVNPPATPSSMPPPPLPNFPKVAEFAAELTDYMEASNLTLNRGLILLQYLYDYDANSLIMVKNTYGFIEIEYYYYNIKKKSLYYGGRFCNVSSISENVATDGTSSILVNGKPHVRPLNDFLLFSSTEPGQQVTPVFIGTDTVRGIPVNKWQSCFANRDIGRTERRIWSFARPDYQMPGDTGPDGVKYSVPIQALISISLVFPNGTQVFENDEEFNIISFRPGIMESATQLAPPKAAFCKGDPDQKLVSLKDYGIEWPNHFSVRIDASTSRGSRWQRFHLRYDQGRESNFRRIRYDFMPDNGEDFQSIIHDYTNDVTYDIDRRVGSCKITKGVDIPDVNLAADPIRFFIKHESRFIFNPAENAWEMTGIRECRGKDITCISMTSSIPSFPPIVEPDLGVPAGLQWEATNIEYAWAMRSPLAQAAAGSQRFDYPVSLFLRTYRYQDPANPSILSVLNDEVEYEFYEMSSDRDQSDFDISICYRSAGYEYLHLVFTLTLNKGEIADSNKLNKRDLSRRTHATLVNAMNIPFTRISDIEIEHERTNNKFQVFFTALGRTPKPDSESGFKDDEPTAADAVNSLRSALDSGTFRFELDLEDGSKVQLTGESQSLKVSEQYMSTHGRGDVKIEYKYKGGAIAGAIIGGLIVGAIIGFVGLVIYRYIKKEPLPSLPSSIPNPVAMFSAKPKQSLPTPTASNA